MSGVKRSVPVHRTTYGRPLSPTRQRILGLIEAQAVPVSVAVILRDCELHENTVRGHLEDLVRDGYLRKDKAGSDGRGRPAWLWSAVSPSRDSPYVALASALAEMLHETSDDPARDAESVGRRWGHEIARELPDGKNAPADALAARIRVVDVLRDAGFAPTSDPTHEEVKLMRCPFIEAASQHSSIICGLHLGVVQGTLESMGFDSTGSELKPFFEPGQCRLKLAATPLGPGTA